MAATALVQAERQRQQLRKGVGSRLRIARLQLGLTQAEYAEKLGHSGAWLSDIERGLAGIDLFDLCRCATLSKLPLDYFFGGLNAVPTPNRPHSDGEWESLFPDDPGRGRAHAELDQFYERTRWTQPMARVAS